MSGWTNKGGAKPTWMGCEHSAGKDGRCCGAIEVPGFVQVAHIGRNAVAGADMEPVIAKGNLEGLARAKGDPQSRNRFMQGKAHLS